MFGRVIGLPNVNPPKGATSTELFLFSPSTKDIFDGLLWPSGGIGIKLKKEDGGRLGEPTIILKVPESLDLRREKDTEKRSLSLG